MSPGAGPGAAGSHRARRRLPRPTVLVAVAGLGASLLGLLGPGPAAQARPAADPPATEPVASVEIGELAPALPVPGDTLVLRGTVVNRSASDLRTVSVRLRGSPRPVTDRAELAQLATGRVERIGSTLWATQTALTDVLPAGQSVAYEITVDVDDLGLPASDGVEVLSVEALGDLVVGDGRGAERVALATTFLPWFPTEPPAPGGTPTRPSGAVWLWPLTAAPAVGSDGVLLDDALGADLAPGGRLRTLLDLAGTAPVPLEVLVDPSLLEIVRSMAAGYEVRGPDGQTRTGAHAAAAGRWLADLQALAQRPTVSLAALAYAQPDVVALHRAGQDLAVLRSVTDAAGRVTAVLQRPVARTLPWPPGGVTDPGTLDLLRASGVPDVVLSSAALRPEQRTAVTPDGIAPLGEDGRFGAVLGDARLARVLTLPTGTPAEAVAVRQRVLADLAMITLEAPADPRIVVITPPPTWSPDPRVVPIWWSALTAARLARGASLAELLASPAADPDAIERRATPYRKRDRRAELPQPYLARVGAHREQLSTFRSITSYADVEQVADIEDGLARAGSALWRDDPGGARDLLGRVAVSLTGLTAQVRVVSRGTTTFPGETGVVPVVVANDLSVPVRVGVELSGTPAVRFDADPYPAFTVAPGTKASVEVPARVLGSGDVQVSVQLTSPDGRAYGPGSAMVVRTTAYARAAGWLVGALVVLLVVLLAVNFVRRRRHRPPSPAATPPGPPPVDADTQDLPDPTGAAMAPGGEP